MSLFLFKTSSKHWVRMSSLYSLVIHEYLLHHNVFTFCKYVLPMAFHMFQRVCGCVRKKLHIRLPRQSSRKPWRGIKEILQCSNGIYIYIYINGIYSTVHNIENYGMFPSPSNHIHDITPTISSASEHTFNRTKEATAEFKEIYTHIINESDIPI